MLMKVIQCAAIAPPDSLRHHPFSVMFQAFGIGDSLLQVRKTRGGKRLGFYRPWCLGSRLSARGSRKDLVRNIASGTAAMNQSGSRAGCMLRGVHRV